jgi:hypothetical protein
MAGRGPAPKDPSKRARRNKDPHPLRSIVAEPVAQPPLPGRPGGDPWPEQTVAWWSMWRENPLSAEFRSEDWAFLADTAVYHAKLWADGDTRAGTELRLRVDQFGMTPTSKARLRITFAQADEADEKRGTRQGGAGASRERYTGLKLAE